MTGHETEKGPAQPLTLMQLMGSVFAAMFGVQTNARRKRDFERGRPGQFIIVGIVFTMLFVLLLWGVVKLVLRLAGV